MFHEIVHNKYVVERFRAPGGRVRRSIWTKCREGSQLLYLGPRRFARSPPHGARAASCKTIDATCPLVTKVHLEAIRFARQGYTIVLIGHEGHDEVIGTMGEAPEAIVLVESPEDVDRAGIPDHTSWRI